MFTVIKHQNAHTYMNKVGLPVHVAACTLRVRADRKYRTGKSYRADEAMKIKAALAKQAFSLAA